MKRIVMQPAWLCLVIFILQANTVTVSTIYNSVSSQQPAQFIAPNHSFTSCANTYASTDVPKSISSTHTSIINVSGLSGTISDVNIKNLNINHTWVGDLDVTLKAPNNVSIRLIDQPGIPVSTFGCSGDNIAVDLDDQAAAANLENTCNVTPPAISGSFKPVDAFAAFNGIDPNGTWTLTIVDNYTAGDNGTLQAWSIEITTGGATLTWYADTDGDTYGNPASSIQSNCPTVAGYVLNNTDCDDTKNDINPNTIWYKDADDDSYSDGTTLTQCTQPAGYQLAANLISTSGDCNDNNNTIRPNATEVCDGIDNNCNGMTDEGGVCTALLAISALDANKAEGNSGTTNFTFSVTRTGNLNSTVSIKYDVSGSVDGADFAGGTLPSGTVTFNATETMQTIPIPVQGDLTIEPNETFTVTLSMPTGDVSLTTATANSTIQNDDIACPASGLVYVNANSPGGDDGLSWNTAFDKLQDALNLACNCNVGTKPEIWVAAGTYYPDEGINQTDNNRNSTFQLCNNAKLYGGFSGNGTETSLSQRNIAANVTILSGDIDGDDDPFAPDNDDDNDPNTPSETDHIKGNNAYHVVTGSGTDATALLDGFTITAGNAGGKGGGMYNVTGSPTVANCTFSGNTGTLGGGMYNDNNSSPSLSNCTFSRNTSRFDGGGMYNDNNSSPTVSNCTFSGNTAIIYGGGMYNNNNSSPIVTNCTFSDNTCRFAGGGMYNDNNSSPTVSNCTFSDNSVTINDGGGMYNRSSSPTVANCTFSGNTAGFGGGMYNDDNSSPTLTNCTFLGNSADDDGGGMYNISGSSPTLTNCTFRGNSAEDWGGGMVNSTNAAPTLTNCNFTDNNANGDGGGMYNISGASPTLTNCNFTGNNANDGGGGMYNSNSSSPELINCKFLQNTSNGDGGGMMNAGGSTPTLINCNFSGNSAKEWGGGMRNVGFSTLINCSFSGNQAGEVGGGVQNGNNSTFINCSFSGNKAAISGGGIHNRGGIAISPTFTNCIVWNNEDNSGTGTANASVFNNNGATPIFSYSLIQSSGGSDSWNAIIGTDGGNNKDVDPQFVEVVNPADAPTTAGDLRLQPASPAINMGNNAADIDGTNGTQTIQDIATDLSGNPRILENIVDMGAYEQLSCDAYSFTNQIAYVNVNALGSNNGSDWTNAFTDLQSALTVACNCPDKIKEIWVAAGTYYPDEGINQTDNARSSTFQLCNGVAIYGGFNGTETMLSQRNVTANVTILSGDLQKDDAPNIAVANLSDAPSRADNAYHVVTGSGTDATALLDGFTITAGNANVGGGSNSGRGGGMFNDRSSPSVSNCTFSGNSAIFGGGMYNTNSSPSLTNCTFSGNSASSSGGGMYNGNSSPTIANCTFSGNNSASDGGGMFNDRSSPSVSNCTFSGNSASSGGGMYNFFNSSPSVTNCTFSGNSAILGGGMSNDRSSPSLTNTIIWNNRDDRGTGTASASIFNASSTPTIAYSLIQSSGGSGAGWQTSLGTDGGNNKEGDPLFVTPVDPTTAPTTAGNLRLQPTSPAINMGNNAVVTVPPFLADGEGDPIDLDGNKRIVANTVDMGAYESPCPTITAEIAGTTGICPSGSANVTVTITGGAAPYTVVYSPDGGTTQVTVNDYESGDDIAVMPGASTTYTLISVTDANGCVATTLNGSAVVTVEDVTDPVFDCSTLSDLTQANDAGKCEASVTINAPQATDNCDGTVIATGTRSDNKALKALSDPYPVGTTTITWTFTDKANNSINCEQKVIISDTEEPIAACKTATITLNATGTYTLQPSEIDNNSADNCGIVKYSLSQTDFTCADIGKQLVKLTVEDAAGLKDECSIEITVLASAACEVTIANAGGPSIADPCTCSSVPGLFDEEIIITGNAENENWVLSANSGFLDPATGNPYPSGTAFIYIGNNQYSLVGRHAAGVGFNITATSEFYPNDPQTISNKCDYPSVEAGNTITICQTKPVNLVGVGQVNNATGIWSTSGDGQFVGGTKFGETTAYIPGVNDKKTGKVILTLTADSDLTNCDFTDQLIITILKTDCGQFPWNGNK
ncbi:MAG: right-handed parallel beta-helix repeat-containing protein [Saprospiraceae bacterium]